MTDFVTENTTPVNNSAAGSGDHKDPTKEYRTKLVQKLIENVKRESEFIKKFHELFGDYPGLNSDTCLYRFVNDLDRHFPAGTPSLRCCQRLLVEGEFEFGRGIVLRGDVKFRNPNGECRIVPDGLVVENDEWPAQS